MAEPVSLSGVLGAITGTISLIVSIMAYRRAGAVKSLDLRIELQRAYHNLDLLVSGIQGRVDFVAESHRRVLAADGKNNSGEWNIFTDEVAADTGRLRRLLAAQPRREGNLNALSQEQLEPLLVEIHAFHLQLADLRSKYDRLFASDEERRRELRARYER